MTPRDLLAAGRIRTFDYCPYLASYVYSLKQQQVTNIATCGVSEDGVLYWDPKFVESLDRDTMAYVILHEALHLIYRHHARSREVYGEHPDEQQRLVMNIAGDLVIEQTLSFMRPLRPPSAVHLGAVCSELGITLDFPPNLSMLEYYGLIMAQLRQRPKDKGKGPGDQDGDADGDGNTTGDPGSNSRASDKKGQKKSGKKGSADKPNGRSAACKPGAGGSGGDGVRRPYEQPDESWQAFAESMAAQKVEDAIRKHEEQHPGSVPGQLKETISQFLRPQRDPFAHLKSVVATTTQSPIGGRMQTYRRLSRKQPPDICRLRGRITTQASAVVIVDTSGSMGDRETKERALQVIADGLKKLQSVKVVCADTHVRSSARLRDASNFEWVGGGGTDMAVALEQVDRADKPDSIVLITDAMTGWPARRTRAQVVVALTCDSSYASHIPKWCKTVPLF